MVFQGQYLFFQSLLFLVFFLIQRLIRELQFLNEFIFCVIFLLQEFQLLLGQEEPVPCLHDFHFQLRTLLLHLYLAIGMLILHLLQFFLQLIFFYFLADLHLSLTLMILLISMTLRKSGRIVSLVTLLMSKLESR